MAKKSGSATPGGKGGAAPGKSTPSQATPGGAPGKTAPAKAKPGGAPGKPAPGGAPAKAAQPPAALVATRPGVPAGAAGAAGDTSDADGPCFEFRQVIDEDGNPVLRKFEVPCPEK
ncbi:MAG TPA: hypothetical protein VHG32_10430 [Thermoanaerobaculia bacterium]|jgi:hypothetical protein|nr:hypothetical protein [Thermoanaerobaculia bacterium]